MPGMLLPDTIHGKINECANILGWKLIFLTSDYDRDLQSSSLGSKKEGLLLIAYHEAKIEIQISKIIRIKLIF